MLAWLVVQFDVAVTENGKLWGRSSQGLSQLLRKVAPAFLGRFWKQAHLYMGSCRGAAETPSPRFHESPRSAMSSCTSMTLNLVQGVLIRPVNG